MKPAAPSSQPLRARQIALVLLALILLLVALLFLLHRRRRGPPFEIVVAQEQTVVDPYSRNRVTAEVVPHVEGVKLTWTCTGGSIRGQGRSVVWVAPAAQDVYTVVATGRDSSGRTRRDEVRFEVRPPITSVGDVRRATSIAQRFRDYPPGYELPRIEDVSADKTELCRGEPTVLSTEVENRADDQLRVYYTWYDPVLRKMVGGFGAHLTFVAPRVRGTIEITANAINQKVRNHLPARRKIRITVLDCDYRVDWSKGVHARFVWSRIGPSRYQFLAQLSRVQANPIVAYYWVFGDGQVQRTTIPVVEHVYKIDKHRPRQFDYFKVTLRVHGRDGSVDESSRGLVVRHDYHAQTQAFFTSPRGKQRWNARLEQWEMDVQIDNRGVFAGQLKPIKMNITDASGRTVKTLLVPPREIFGADSVLANSSLKGTIVLPEKSLPEGTRSVTYMVEGEDENGNKTASRWIVFTGDKGSGVSETEEGSSGESSSSGEESPDAHSGD